MKEAPTVEGRNREKGAGKGEVEDPKT